MLIMSKVLGKSIFNCTLLVYLPILDISLAYSNDFFLLIVDLSDY